MNDDDKILVCEECGSSDVQIKAWINANTLQFVDDSGDCDRYSNWCGNCQEHVYLCSRSNYLKNREKDNDTRVDTED